MPLQIAGGAGALLGGVTICYLNYRISRAVLIKSPSYYALVTVLRQIFSVAWLLACYAISECTQLSAAVLLVCAALGVTVPSFFLTHKLLRLNEQRTEIKTQEKEERSDG